MKVNFVKFFTLFFSIFIFTPSLSFAEEPQTKFGFAEHAAAGDKVKLKFSSNTEGQTSASLTLPVGVELTYGEAFTLADFYGILDSSITEGKTADERKARFISVFNQFAYDTDRKNELNLLLDTVRYEKRIVKHAIEYDRDVAEVLKENANEIGRRINCTTGGGCMESGWWLYPGRALKLANTNFDHFNDNAIKAYKAGHQAALEQALIAHASQNQAQLQVAYAMNALASHYLSDRFSAGHIRTPRKMLSDRVTPATVGSLLARYMHDEENVSGIYVTNNRGDRWMAYGDMYYFGKSNEYNRSILQEVLQKSADEVFYVYQNGKLPTQSDWLNNLVPQAEEVTEFQYNLSPLFYWRKSDNTLLRRQDISNIFDRNYTSDWWGWSTLAELKRVYG